MRRLLGALLLMVTACSHEADAVSLTPQDFSDIPGWNQDRHDHALMSFFHSCERAEQSPSPMNIANVKRIPTHTWQSLCQQAKRLRATPWGAKGFFERYFTPYRVTDRSGSRQGKLTGYYVPILKGSWKKNAAYAYPAYALPEGSQSRLTRAAIDAGALAGKGLELIYLNDPVMLYFMQIQGSGLVEMNDGSRVRLSYAGNNGQTYYPIGKELIRRGVLAAHQVSLDSIRNWLYANPHEAPAVLSTNPRYIFFSLDRHPEAFGAQGVALTAERSLAVDPSYIPYGLPVFVSTTLGLSGTPYERLMIAQDTGSAIRGAIRGDIFFGIGEEAEKMAGPMNNTGEFTLLLPRE